MYQSIIRSYIHNRSYIQPDKHVYEYELGELIFWGGSSTAITVFGIYFHPEKRNQGLCRGLLQNLIDQIQEFNASLKKKKKIHKLIITCVLSKVLYEYLGRFRYKNRQFIQYSNGDWILNL